MLRFYGYGWYLFLLAALSLALLVTSAPAAPRSRYVQPGHTQYNHYIPPESAKYNEIRARIISDVLQINPAYFAYYSPDGYDGTAQQLILDELRRQGFRLDQVAGLVQAQGAKVLPGPTGQPAAVVVPVPPPAPRTASLPPSAAAGLAVLNQNCAACHQEGKLLPDQRFTLLDSRGQMVALTDRQKNLVIKRTMRKQMPPPDNKFGYPPLADADFAAVELLINGN